MDRATIVYPAEPPRYPLYDESALDDEKGWMINNVHDPAIFKDGDWYYVFSTDRQVGRERGDTPIRAGAQIRRSRNLIEWEWVGRAFDGVPEEAYCWTHAKTLWAPDCVKFGDTYYLYYVASQFGKNQSFIGVATSSSPEGPWVDRGEVWKTKAGDVPNAIDPNIAFDRHGDPWMVYGSFFGGIYVSRIDPTTGKLVHYGEGTLIARRSQEVAGAVEGPYIVYNPAFDKYYLFVSYDSLFSDYNIRVGRSDSITGPYVDYNGHLLTDTEFRPQSEIGNKIAGSYAFANDDGWVAPGHNSVLKDGDDYFIVHHARGARRPEWSYLHVRRILWTPDGWPVVSPERYAGEYEQRIPESAIPGRWEWIVFERSVNTKVLPVVLEFSKAGVVTGAGRNGEWKAVSANGYQIRWDSGDLDYIRVLPAWDWEKWCPTLVCTGLNQAGVSCWGKRIPEAKG